MDVFYIVVMKTEQRELSYAQAKVTSVYARDLPLVCPFWMNVLEELRILWWQSGCRQPVGARAKTNHTARTSYIARWDFMLAQTFMQNYKTTVLYKNYDLSQMHAYNPTPKWNIQLGYALSKLLLRLLEKNEFNGRICERDRESCRSEL